MHIGIEPPYHITLSSDPIDNNIDVPIPLRGTHDTLGLHIEMDTKMNRIQLRNCISSTPAAKIPRWRSTLRDGYI